MSVFRSSVKSAGVAAAIAALALGMFAASAVGWYGKEEKPDKHKTTPTETTPTVTTPTQTTPTVTTPPVVPPPPVVEEVQPPALVTVAPAAAPAPAVAVAPAPASLPQEEVKGETGTRNEESGGGGGNGPTVVAQAADTGSGEAASPSGELAQTGLNTSVLALLGGLALAGSAALVRRTRLD